MSSPYHDSLREQTSSADESAPWPKLLKALTDDELTDAWLAGERLPGGISHDQHLRIAWVLIRRHGGVQAEQRLVSGTRRACEAHGVPEKFDEALTRRWAHAIAELVERDGPGVSAGAFIIAHPELGEGGRFKD
jgi:hypothetical protein